MFKIIRLKIIIYVIPASFWEYLKNNNSILFYSAELNEEELYFMLFGMNS